MNIQPYRTHKYHRGKHAYTFLSIGPKKVKKVVEFLEMEDPGLYNLSLGDQNSRGKVSYSSVTDNKDTAQVMRTVAHIVEVFTAANPSRMVFLRGDNPVKTRLYQIFLSNNLDAVQKEFRLWGALGGGRFEVFQKGKNYLAFLVKRL